MTHCIIDGNSLYARAFYSITGAGSNVEPWVAAFNILASMLNAESKNYLGEEVGGVLMCWDGDTSKTDKNRSQKPEGYHEQKKQFQRETKYLLGIPSWGEGLCYEADDLVCEATRRCRAKNDDVIVCSHDKDIQQLVTKRVKYYCLSAKRVLSIDEILKKWHVPKPIHIAVYLALVGDRIDGIAGVDRFGPKKAEALFSQWVKPDMKFNEVVESVRKHVPKGQEDNFLNSLCATLLGYDDSLRGVVMPEPAPLKLRAIDDLKDHHVPIETPYTRLYRQINGEESITDEGFDDL